MYSAFAHEFDRTRYSVWKCVREFLDGFPGGSKIGEWGCGNGKNMLYRSDLDMIGFDICPELVSIAQKKNLNVILGDCLDPPVAEGSLDGIICVAVLHHIRCHDDRVKFVEKLRNCLRPGGKALITVWAREQPIPAKWEPLDENPGDYLVPWGEYKAKRYYHLFTRDEVEDLFGGLDVNIYFEMNNWVIMLKN
jgi:tRNA (uracil-5-)-methyltransferase TRM9